VNTLKKAFRIIEDVVAHQEKGLSFSEIVSLTRAPKASAHRILKALVEMGYLYFNKETGKYYGDLKLSGLGSEVTSHFDLKNYVHPYLLKLHAETKHTCHLGIRSGNVGIYLDKIESKDFGIKLFSEVGKSFPLHCTAMGKVLLTFMGPEKRKEALKGKLQPYTSRTVVRRLILEKELKTVRKNGYAVDHEEITRGIMCVAAPIQNREGNAVASVSATFPSYIDKDRGIEGEIQAVKRCASAITEYLRGNRG
jgi:DNA-binding IclR family transcriptional regulator